MCWSIDYHEAWKHSDKYFSELLTPADATLDAVVLSTAENDLPNIAVSTAQGKFLHLLVKSIGARRVVEVGTLGGYLAIWLARALPEDGEMVTLELSDKCARVCVLASRVKVVVGPAERTMKELPSSPKFDLAFIDADKESNLEYFREAKRIVRSGGVINDSDVDATVLGTVGEKGYDGFMYAVRK
ncbi:S-adenosyl-L-methionine-dependent methyltransferase [Hymenopellis radicata]|nr:S-adenosyl-L-methionine-dependent methyltransferase [Hymenopellis radicata]